MLEKESIDYLAWIALILSLLSAFFAYQANGQNNQSSKENFKNNLRDKLKSIKYKMFEIGNREYEHREKMFLIESVNDLMMYQQYNEEKKLYLTTIQKSKLSRLQEEVEDNLGLVLSGEDGYHKDAIVSSVNDFLKVV